MGVMEQYVGEFSFISPDEYSALKRTFKALSNSAEYAMLVALYENAGQAKSLTEKLQVVTLFLQNLERLSHRNSAPAPALINTVEDLKICYDIMPAACQVLSICSVMYTVRSPQSCTSSGWAAVKSAVSSAIT